MKTILLTFLPIIIWSQNNNCDTIHNFIDVNKISYHFFSDSGKITQHPIRYYSTVTDFKAFKLNPTDSMDWTNSWRNEFYEEPLTYLKSYSYGVNGRKDPNSNLQIFSTEHGVTLNKIGFDNDSTILTIDSLALNNRTTFDDIKDHYFCSAILSELDLLYCRKYETGDSIRVVQFHINPACLSDSEYRDFDGAFWYLSCLASLQLIMVFESDLLTRIEIIEGS